MVPFYCTLCSSFSITDFLCPKLKGKNSTRKELSWQGSQGLCPGSSPNGLNAKVTVSDELWLRFIYLGCRPWFQGRGCRQQQLNFPSISLSSHGWLSLNDQAVAVRGRKWNRRRERQSYPPWRAQGASSLSRSPSPQPRRTGTNPLGLRQPIAFPELLVNLGLSPHQLGLPSGFGGPVLNFLKNWLDRVLL